MLGVSFCVLLLYITSDLFYLYIYIMVFVGSHICSIYI